MSSLFRKIDELSRPDHYYLEPGDGCFFLREYVAGGGYQASESNQLILNLKKDLKYRGTPSWRYKSVAIDRCAGELRTALAKYLDGWTVVPVPPSKAKTDPDYDDRISQVCAKLCGGTRARFCDLIVQQMSTSADHLQDTGRRTPDAIGANYRVEQALAMPEPTHIWVVDDVLTTGAHFKAVQSVLLRSFPRAQVYGVFIARRVPLANDELDGDGGL